jgi:hypothetical protein
MGAAPLNPQDLRIVWFEEGEGAALLEHGEPVAVIPPWSGIDGFNGYARDCVSENPLCWPLTLDNVVLRRIARAEEFWASWDQPQNPWNEIQRTQFEAYTAALGQYEKYYAIDGGNWPSKALIRTPTSGGFTLTTIGVALRPQPAVEFTTDNPAPLRRFELGIGLSNAFAHFLEPVARYLSAQSNLPWAVYSWLGPGHTIPCDAFAGTNLTAILLQYHPLGSPPVSLPPFRNDPVNLLWAVPITRSEQEFAVAQGKDKLVVRLNAANVSWLSQARKAVV